MGGDLRPHEEWRRTYRLARWVHTHGGRGLPGWLVRRNRRRFGLDLPPEVGSLTNVFLMHSGLGTVISPQARIAGPAIVFHEVTLGVSFGGAVGEPDGAPSVGRWVLIGAGAKLLGPIAIGDAVVVGANTVVTTDVPTGSLVVGNPARITPLPVTDVLARFHPDLRPEALGVAPPTAISPHPDARRVRPRSDSRATVPRGAADGLGVAPATRSTDPPR